MNTAARSPRENGRWRRALRAVIRWSFFVALLGLTLAVVFGTYAHFAVPMPETVTYGVSFNTPYARELGLDWQAVYTAILDDLKVRRLRLAAHWPMVEPEADVWNFAELDTQLDMAQERGATVVLAVGRRLPRWPECHVPEWAKGLTKEEQQARILAYLETVVSRYKGHPAVEEWQVENEPYLTVFAYEHCGELDRTFLAREVALVRELDPSRKILVTDSGNLGLWHGAYRSGDKFGTSVYLYLWNEVTGPIKSILPAQTYVLKRALMRLLYGEKESVLIELSAEPWLDRSLRDAPLALQLERMNVSMFEEILSYARHTRFDTQYLWGAEWWYWLKETQGDSSMWERARTLYTTPFRPASGL